MFSKRTIYFFIFIPFLVACGHESTFEDAKQFSTSVGGAEPLPAVAAPVVGGFCQGFGQDVFSFNPGNGAGFGQNKMPDVVLGAPHGRGGQNKGSADVVSLGFDGEIVIDLGNCHAVDDAGLDFIVFENAFLIGGIPDNPYKELGRVSVSPDGVNFIEFPCDDINYPHIGCSGWKPIYSNPFNGIDPFDPLVAGGEAFDLADIGVAQAKYIRIQSIGGGGLDPTKVGYDLDAVAVINGIIDN